MSTVYDRIKEYYDNGAWTIERVRDAVGRWINPEEYKQITGEKY